MFGHQPHEPPATRGRGRGRGRQRTWSPPPPPPGGTVVDDEGKEPRPKQQRSAHMDSVKEQEQKPRSPRLAGRGRAVPRRPEQQLYVPKALRNRANQSQSSVSSTKRAEPGSRQAVRSENTASRKGERVIAETDSCTVPRVTEAESKAADGYKCSEATEQSKEAEDRTESFCAGVTHHPCKNTELTESVCSESAHLKEDSGVTESECPAVTHLKKDSEVRESVCSEVSRLEEDSGVTRSECSAVTHFKEDSSVTESEFSEVTHIKGDLSMMESECYEVSHLKENSGVTESEECSVVTHLKEDSGVMESECSAETHFKVDSGVTESECSEVSHIKEDSGVTESDCSAVTHIKEDLSMMESESTAVTDLKEDLGVTESEDFSAVTDLKEDSGLTESGECSAVTDLKEDSGVTESESTALTDLKGDLDVMESEHSEVTHVKDDSGVTQSEECSAVTDLKEDSGVTESESTAVTDLKGDLDVMESEHSEATRVKDDSGLNPAGDTCPMETSDTKHSDSEGKGASQGSEEEEGGDEDSWDKLFDDNGDCLNPSMIEELTAHVGEVEITKPQKTINYLDYTPRETDLDMAAYSHVVEISDFPEAFQTTDLLMAFKEYMKHGFDIKWVDDTHALGIFSSTISANSALDMIHPMMKVKPMSEASKQSRLKVKRCQEFLQPYKARPQTSAAAARRLVTGALGLAPRVPKEKREEERKVLKEAREKKRNDRKRKEDIWDGNLGNCAMDNC